MNIKQKHPLQNPHTPLLRALEQANSRQKEHSIARLGATQSHGLWLLRLLLRSKDWEIRSEVVFAMGKLPHLAKQICPHLEQSLSDPDPRVRRESIVSLTRLGTFAFPSLSRALQHKDLILRMVAIRRLARNPQAALPILLSALHNNDMTVRWSARRALRSLGLHPNKPWRNALQAPNPSVRLGAVWMLGRLGPKSHPILKIALTDKSPTIRLQLLQSMSRWPSLPPNAQITLKKLQTDPDFRIRIRALQLFIHQSNTLEKIHLLQRAIDDPQQLLRMEALKWTTLIGTKALPILEKGLYDREKIVRQRALQQLFLLRSEGIPLLLLCSLHKDPSLRLQAKNRLERMRLRGRYKLKWLLKMLRSRHTHKQDAAILLIGQMGPQAHRATLPLQQMLQHATTRQQHNIQLTLAKIKPTPPPTKRP